MRTRMPSPPTVAFRELCIASTSPSPFWVRAFIQWWRTSKYVIVWATRVTVYRCDLMIILQLRLLRTTRKLKIHSTFGFKTPAKVIISHTAHVWNTPFDAPLSPERGAQFPFPTSLCWTSWSRLATEFPLTYNLSSKRIFPFGAKTWNSLSESTKKLKKFRFKADLKNGIIHQYINSSWFVKLNVPFYLFIIHIVIFSYSSV